MINSLSLRNPNIVDNISLTFPRKFELPKEGFKQEKVNTVIQATNSSTSSNENKSVSSRSSQSEFSDVVKLNGPLNQTSGTTDTSDQKGFSSQSVLESKPTIALFIGDLDGQINETILTNIFNRFKSLVSVKVCRDVESGKSLGYGYLNFSEKQDTLAVIEEFNYRPIFGKEVRIMPSLRNTFYRKNVGTNVFFSNLPLENPRFTTRVFYDTFKNYGNILSCKLDKRKNIGFIYFENDQSARMVIREFNDKGFFGNRILCGIHFDREIRKFPEFEKRKLSLNDITIPKEQLTLGPTDTNTVEHDSTQHIPHPNAIFVKNLPSSCTDDEILNYFSSIGPVKSVYSSKSQRHKSLWAFITYKKGSDTGKAVKTYDDSKFRGRKLSVIRAKLAKNSDKKPTNRSPYRPMLYLENLSSICNEQFLSQMCIQERIKIENLAITDFFQDSFTYSGHIKCRSKKDADKISALLNNRLIGGCEVKVSWKKPVNSHKENVHNRTITNSNNINHDGSDRTSVMSPIEFYQSRTYLKAPKHFTNNRLPGQPQPQFPTAIFPMPIFPTPAPTAAPAPALTGSMYCPPPIALAPNISARDRDENMTQVLDYLKRQVRKGVDFLRFPTATKSENISRLTNYIFENYWHCDLNQLTRFLLLMNANTQNESILNKQIEEAAMYLGFNR